MPGALIAPGMSDEVAMLEIMSKIVFASAFAMMANMQAQANVLIAGTRIVYPAHDREVTIRIENPDNAPALIQAWVDRGDPATRPDTADAPFILNPPMVRIEPKMGQALRLMFTQEPLPQDRESLFWFNMLDIPHLPRDKEANYVQIAYRTRLKLFYRPDGLSGTPTDAAEEITWTVTSAADGSTVLHARNASGFHVSFNEITVEAAGRSYEVETEVAMIEPNSSMDFRITGNLSGAQAGEMTVKYKWINDFGSSQLFEKVLGR